LEVIDDGVGVEDSGGHSEPSFTTKPEGMSLAMPSLAPDGSRRHTVGTAQRRPRHDVHGRITESGRVALTSPV
jgi:hypothetical protein